MIGHDDLQKAMRVKLLALSVATTGATSLSATATGIHRAAGSFVAEGFAKGMWVTRTGFATNTPGVITNVTATDLDLTLYLITSPAGVQTVANPAMAVESVAGARTITAGLPALAAWENSEFEPVAGAPWIEEQYLPGPEAVTHDGYQGRLELRPMYQPRIYVPEGVGIGADGKYADAIRRLFKPGTSLPLPTGAAGDVCIALDKPAAMRGQRLHSTRAGFSFTPVTIPFRALTVSSLP